MTVQTARVLVRPVTPSDRDAVVHELDRSAAFLAPWVPKLPQGVGADWQFERSIAMQAKGEALRLIGVVPDGRVAAFASLNAIVRGATDGATAGWSVTVDFAGQGYATEVVRAMLDIAFSPRGLGLHRVGCAIMPENARSLRVAEKLGFRREGFAPKLLRIAGAWRDHVLFAKLAEEHGA